MKDKTLGLRVSKPKMSALVISGYFAAQSACPLYHQERTIWRVGQIGLWRLTRKYAELLGTTRREFCLQWHSRSRPYVTKQLMIHGPLISEFDDAVRHGSQEKQVKTLKRITDLFLSAKGGPLEFSERLTSLAAGIRPMQCHCSSCWARKRESSGMPASRRQGGQKASKRFR